MEAAARALGEVMAAYPFDALSYYLRPTPLAAADHLRIYRSGHCLDLAVALFYQLGGQLVGQRKPGAPYCHHYALLLPNLWLDPSLGVCTPLSVGAVFYLGAKRNEIYSVGDGRLGLLIDGNRAVEICYEPIQDLELERRYIQRTRKDLTLRYQGEQLRYLWRQDLFEWGEHLLLPEDLGEAECAELSATFGVNIGKLLRAFRASYRRLGTDAWDWEI